MASPWDNVELTNDLAAQLALGVSFRLIAAELSAKYQVKITRNACIGRARRLGFETERKSDETDLCAVKRTSRKREPKPQKVDPVRRQITVIRRCNGNSQSIRALLTTETTFVPRCVEIVPRHLTLMELEKHDCRYPYGEEGEPITFCGHRVRTKINDQGKEVALPYCVPHAILCFTKPKPHHAPPFLSRGLSRVFAI